MANRMASSLASALLLLLMIFPAMSGRKLQPSDPTRKLKSYAVIFDAGSTGSRVHVYAFDDNLDLVPFDNALEVSQKVKPGLSAYPKNPHEAANSLVPLLKTAESVVPAAAQPYTPTRLGATAGLRLIGEEPSNKILQAVRELLRDRSSLKYEEGEVTLLTGTQEGSYMWVTVNYLLGNLGNKYSKTVATIDLGGGSVQMAYAISEEEAANSPKVAPGEDPYVTQMFLKGTKYYIYVHSYLNYGQNAARTQILKVTGNSSANPCILAGFDDYFNYNGIAYKAAAPRSGSNFNRCRRVAIDALNLNATCKYKECTFGGSWSGGGGGGRKNVFAGSAFYYLPVRAGIIKPDVSSAEVRPIDFKNAARIACATSLADARSKYPQATEEYLPYLCMDLVYEYTLLIQGFGLRPTQKITVGLKIEYQKSEVEAAWPLGNAIETVSTKTGSQVYVINLANIRTSKNLQLVN